MVGAAHQEYTNRFNELSRLVPYLVTPEPKRIGRYIWGLAPQIRGMVKSAMPSTFQSAVVLAGSLTNEMVRNGSLANPGVGNKKEWTSNSAKRKDEGLSKQNIHKTIKSYAGIEKEERKPCRGTHPLCYQCGRHHSGEFCQDNFCFRCKKSGHTIKDCEGPSNPRQVCFHCGVEGHVRNACPKRKGKQPVTQNKHIRQ